MVKIDKLTEEDERYYKEIIERADMLFGMDKTCAYKLTINDIEEILFVCGPIFMIFYYEDCKKIVCSSFVVDENYQVISLTEGQRQINIYEEMVYVIDENYVHSSLCFKKNKQELDFEVANNGIVSYMQYDLKQNVRVCIDYEHNFYCNRDEIYPYHLQNPLMVSIENCVKQRDKGLKFIGFKKRYYRYDFDVRDNKLQYDLSTIKDVGLGAVLARNTISLQGEKSFSRYYRVLFTVGDYITITGFPFLKQYTFYDIENIVKELGACFEVPDDLVNLYNHRHELICSRQNIAHAYQNSEYSLTNEKYLKYK